MKRKLRNDILLAAVLLTAAVLLFFLLESGKKPGAFVVVSVDGKEIQRISLEEDAEYEIGEESANVLVLKEGEAYMKEASCPDQICVQHRPISKTGESIICLPHKVVISIEEEKKQEADLVV